MRRFFSSRVIDSPHFLPGTFFLLADISPAFKNFRCQGQTRRRLPLKKSPFFKGCLDNENFEWLHNEKAFRKNPIGSAQTSTFAPMRTGNSEKA